LICEPIGAVDTITATGKMLFTVLGAVAELERSLIVERARAGLRKARAEVRTFASDNFARRAIHCAGLASDLALSLGVLQGSLICAGNFLSVN
jgi:hypothetical protein